MDEEQKLYIQPEGTMSFNNEFSSYYITPEPNVPIYIVEDNKYTLVMRWKPIFDINVENAYGVDFLLFSEELKDPDFNPSGVVEGHYQDEPDAGWYAAIWNNDMDCYDLEKVNPTHYCIKVGPT